MNNPIDWRNAAVIMAGDVVKLAEMVRSTYPNTPEITDPLNEVEERCASMIASAAIDGARN